MSTRYVWGVYTREVKQILVDGYKEKRTNAGTKKVNDYHSSSEKVDYFYIYRSIYISQSNGSISGSGGARYYTTDYTNGSYVATGYMSVSGDSDGYDWLYGTWYKYNDIWSGGYVKSDPGYGVESSYYQEYENYYVRGSLTGYASSSNSGQYPNDSYTGGTWYTKLGSDSIDAESVTIPSQIDGGTMINISIAPASGVLGNTTISYVIQYRFDGGTWNTLTTTTTTQYTLSVPMDTQTVQVRVQAKDNIGFISTDYTTSEAVSVTNGDPPTVSSDLGPTPYDMGQVSEPFTFEYTVTDPDYGDSATVNESLYFGEDLGTATSEKEKILSGSKLSFSLFQDLATNEGLTVDDIFLLVPNETQLYASVKAVDSHGLESEEYKVTFEKYVDEVTIKLDPPLSVTGNITDGVIYVNGYIPTDAEFYVHVSNNANDEEPMWQDITTDVLAGRVFKFTNAKAESGASFSFIVHAKRGESKEGGFIDSVVGAFG